MILVAKLAKIVSYLYETSRIFAFCLIIGKSSSAFFSTLTGVVLRLTSESLPCYLTETTIIGCSAWNFQIVKPPVTTAHLFHRESVIDCCDGGKEKLGSVII